MIASRRSMTILVSRSSDVASCKSGGAVQGDASGASGRKNGNGAVLTPYPAATYASQIFFGSLGVSLSSRSLLILAHI